MGKKVSFKMLNAVKLKQSKYTYDEYKQYIDTFVWGSQLILSEEEYDAL